MRGFVRLLAHGCVARDVGGTPPPFLFPGRSSSSKLLSPFPSPSLTLSLPDTCKLPMAPCRGHLPFPLSLSLCRKPRPSAQPPLHHLFSSQAIHHLGGSGARRERTVCSWVSPTIPTDSMESHRGRLCSETRTRACLPDVPSVPCRRGCGTERPSPSPSEASSGSSRLHIWLLPGSQLPSLIGPSSHDLRDGLGDKEVKARSSQLPFPCSRLPTRPQLPSNSMMLGPAMSRCLQIRLNPTMPLSAPVGLGTPLLPSSSLRCYLPSASKGLHLLPLAPACLGLGSQAMQPVELPLSLQLPSFRSASIFSSASYGLGTELRSVMQAVEPPSASSFPLGLVWPWHRASLDRASYRAPLGRPTPLVLPSFSLAPELPLGVSKVPSSVWEGSLPSAPSPYECPSSPSAPVAVSSKLPRYVALRAKNMAMKPNDARGIHRPLFLLSLWES